MARGRHRGTANGIQPRRVSPNPKWHAACAKRPRAGGGVGAHHAASGITRPRTSRWNQTCSPLSTTEQPVVRATPVPAEASTAGKPRVNRDRA
jgi:hypothetical protein